MRPGLRQARKARHLTQAQLLSALKQQRPRLRLTRSGISKMETGRSDIPGGLLLLLSALLDTAPEVIYACAPPTQAGDNAPAPRAGPGPDPGARTDPGVHQDDPVAP